MLRPDQVLFTYLHLAADPAQTEALVKSGATGNCLRDRNGQGRFAALADPDERSCGTPVDPGGCIRIAKSKRWSRRLARWRTGCRACERTGHRRWWSPGTNAAEMAIGLGAKVTILDRSVPRLRQIDNIYGGRVQTEYSTKHSDRCSRSCRAAVLVVGAVLVAGAAAPKLVSAEHVKQMRPGSVLVDISIDQGGCFETSRPTTHAEPTYIVDDVVHYCVTNMPGAVPRTSTFALTNVTLPFVKDIANFGSGRRALARPASRDGTERSRRPRQSRSRRARSRLRIPLGRGCIESSLICISPFDQAVT